MASFFSLFISYILSLLLINTLSSELSTGLQEKSIKTMLEIEGVNQGENLYVINAYLFNEQSYCIDMITLNGNVIMTEPTQKKVGILVSRLEEGQYVNIRIFHKKNCRPRIENPQAISAESTFELISIKVDENHIKWTTKNETTQMPYEVEQLIFKKWVMVEKVIAQGTEGFNNYQVNASHHSGINKYRVKQQDKHNSYRFTELVEYESDKEPVTFYPARVDNMLHFSEETQYEIFNDYGMVVKKGIAKEVEVGKLNSGLYYLNIDNRTEKFLKK